MKRGTLWIAMMVGAAVLTFIGCGRSPQDPPPRSSPATSAPAQRRETPTSTRSDGTWIRVDRAHIRDYVPAVGSFRAHQTTSIGSQVSGRVQEMLVDVGDVVTKDQELVCLDPTFFEIEIAQAQAKLEAVQVAVQDAELNYQRMKNLWEKPGGSDPPSIPRKLYDDARLKFQAVQADLAQARQALRYAEHRLTETVIRAPYNAVVTRRWVDPGEPINATPVTVLLTVQEIATLDLEFSLPQGLLLTIRVGTPFEFTVEGVPDGRGDGRVAVIFPAVDEATRSFRCRAHIENPDLKYRPGLLVRVRVQDREARDAMVLPRQAVRQTATGWQVLVSNAGYPTPQPVEVGIVTEDRVQIVQGLTPDAEVFVPRGTF